MKNFSSLPARISIKFQFKDNSFFKTIKIDKFIKVLNMMKKQAEKEMKREVNHEAFEIEIILYLRMIITIQFHLILLCIEMNTRYFLLSKF